MVNNLKSLIIHQIKATFDNVKVYDEPIKQGLTTPAFLVLIFNSHSERRLANQSKREHSFNVTYFPDTEDKRHECDEVLEHFQNEFRYIADKYHVHEIEGSVSDDVLVITFTVKAQLKEVENDIKMQELGEVNIDEKS